MLFVLLLDPYTMSRTELHSLMSLFRPRKAYLTLTKRCRSDDEGMPRQTSDDVGCNNILQLWGAAPSALVDNVPASCPPATSTSPSLTRSLVPAEHAGPVSSPHVIALLASIPSSQRVVVVDVETTGFHQPMRIMELAAVELQGDEPTGLLFHRVVNASQSLELRRCGSSESLLQKRSSDVHPRARAVHAISPDDEKAGGDEETVLRNFLRFCLGGDVQALLGNGESDWSSIQWPVVVGHNASFDIAVINEHLTRRLGVPERALIPSVGSLRTTADINTAPFSLCTMQLFRMLYPAQSKCGSSLDAVAQFFSVPGREARSQSGHHGALLDASVTASVFCALRAVAADSIEERSETPQCDVQVIITSSAHIAGIEL